MIEIFTEPFMRTVLAGAILTAGTCAYLGVYLILKRVVFMGIALSQVAAMGVALGLFWGVHPLTSSFVLTILAVMLFWLPFSGKNLSREALLGFVYAFAAAMAIILIAKNPLAEAHGLNLVSGNLLYTNFEELRILAGGSIFVGIIHLFFFKEFIFVSFDRETAFAAGLKANFFDFLLYLTIGVMISLSMRISGVIFVFSSLVIPAMSSIMLMGTIGKIFLVAVLIAVTGVMTGLGASYVWDLPTGPTVTGMYGVLFFVLVGGRSLYTKVRSLLLKGASSGKAS